MYADIYIYIQINVHIIYIYINIHTHTYIYIYIPICIHHIYIYMSAPAVGSNSAPGRGNELKRYAMFREDVADLAAVSVSKLKVYVPVLTMSLGYAAG